MIACVYIQKILDEGKAKCHNLLNRFHEECSQRLNQQGEKYGLQQLEEGMKYLVYTPAI